MLIWRCGGQQSTTDAGVARIRENGDIEKMEVRLRIADCRAVAASL
jgi:hypothetical protein